MYQFSTKSNASSSAKKEGSRPLNNGEEGSETDSVIQFMKYNIECKEILCDVHYFRRNEPFKVGETMNSSILCCLAVPSALSLDGFLDFMQPYLSLFNLIRFLRTKKSSVYGVLLECKTVEYANSVYQAMNGAMYPIPNAYPCHLVFVNSIYYHNCTKPSTECNLIQEPVYQTPGSSLLLRDLYSDLHELPPCAICLERLDTEISCLVITFCSHIFHCNCIYRWSNPHCPICRTLQGEETLSQCAVCHSTSSLWICLLCGYIGCGRYLNGHAYQHFLQTQHVYALNIDTQRTWDYLQDRYVHRLVRNETDGKIIPIPSIEEELNTNGITQKKEQVISNDYEQLCSVQLKSQEEYYEEKMADLQNKNAQLSERVKALESMNQKYHKEINQLKQMTKKRQSAQEGSDSVEGSSSPIVCETSSQPSTNEEIIQNLQKRITTMTTVFQFQLQQKDKQIEELTEENNDLYKHISMQATLPKEFESSSILLSPPSQGQRAEPSGAQNPSDQHQKHQASLFTLPSTSNRKSHKNKQKKS